VEAEKRFKANFQIVDAKAGTGKLQTSRRSRRERQMQAHSLFPAGRRFKAKFEREPGKRFKAKFGREAGKRFKANSSDRAAKTLSRQFGNH
jgi:hypothetical protein